MTELSEDTDKRVMQLLRALDMKRKDIQFRSMYTKEEAREKYLEVYPPSFFQRKISTPISQEVINNLLFILCKKKFVSKSVTRFLDGPLAEKDVAVFSITPLGTSVLLGYAKSKK
jgi:hypothetical protein